MSRSGLDGGKVKAASPAAPAGRLRTPRAHSSRVGNLFTGSDQDHYAYGPTLQAFDCTDVPGPVGIGNDEEEAIGFCEASAEGNPGCNTWCPNNGCGDWEGQYDCTSNTFELGGDWYATGLCFCPPIE